MNFSRNRSILGLAMLLVSPACSAHSMSSANSQAIAAPAASPCAADGGRVETLRASAGSADAVRRTIVWSDAVPPTARKLIELVDIEGACAASVNSFAAGMAALRTGEAFAIDENQAIISRGPATAFLVPAEVADHVVPKLANAKFIAAARVDYRRYQGALRSDYIGLWQGKEAWIVAAFTEGDTKPHGPAKILLTSQEPLRGVTYFPAPDTQSGRIGLVQQADARTVRLIGYDWSHQSFFPVK